MFMPYLSIAEVMTRLGYKTRKSVHDLVAAGKLTPIYPKIIRGRGSPRVRFDEAEVAALLPAPHRLSRQQVADRLGISISTVDRLALRGVLKAYPGGRGRRKVEYDEAEVERMKAELEE